MGKLPDTVGVPATIPVAAARLRPAGSDPEVIVHTYGASPPDAPSCAVYALPITAAGKLGVEICTPEALADVLAAFEDATTPAPQPAKPITARARSTEKWENRFERFVLKAKANRAQRRDNLMPFNTDSQFVRFSGTGSADNGATKESRLLNRRT